MDYRATLTIDFTNQNTAQYQKLVAALLQVGWKYQETSAFTIDASKLDAIWGAFDLVARQAADAGELSALTIHVQGSPNFAGSPYAAAVNHPNAKEDILKKAFPAY